VWNIKEFAVFGLQNVFRYDSKHNMANGPYGMMMMMSMEMAPEGCCLMLYPVCGNMF
jgi:hypothetical protein